MKDIIIHFLIGLFLGIFVTVGLIVSNKRIQTEYLQRSEIEEIQVPTTLPSNEENYDAELPKNLSEVIL